MRWSSLVLLVLANLTAVASPAWAGKRARRFTGDALLAPVKAPMSLVKSMAQSPRLIWKATRAITPSRGSSHPRPFRSE
jgi:hypothetical protein